MESRTETTVTNDLVSKLQDERLSGEAADYCSVGYLRPCALSITCKCHGHTLEPNGSGKDANERFLWLR